MMIILPLLKCCALITTGMKALNKEFKDAPEEKQKDEAYLASLDQRAAAIMKEIIAVKMKYVKANPSRFMARWLSIQHCLEFDAVQAEKRLPGIG